MELTIKNLQEQLPYIPNNAIIQIGNKKFIVKFDIWTSRKYLLPLTK